MPTKYINTMSRKVTDRKEHPPFFSNRCCWTDLKKNTLLCGSQGAKATEKTFSGLLVKGMESTLLLNQETATEKMYDFFKLSEHTEETRPNINQSYMHNYLFPQLH